MAVFWVVAPRRLHGVTTQKTAILIILISKRTWWFREKALAFRAEGLGFEIDRI
jgi:hypothetical protein